MERLTERNNGANRINCNNCGAKGNCIIPNTCLCEITDRLAAYSAATNTGAYSAAEVTGKASVAIATGSRSKVRGAKGCAIVLVERGEYDGETYPIKAIKAVKIDGKRYKADTWHKLVDGKVVEAE